MPVDPCGPSTAGFECFVRRCPAGWARARSRKCAQGYRVAGPSFGAERPACVGGDPEHSRQYGKESRCKGK